MSREYTREQAEALIRAIREGSACEICAYVGMPAEYNRCRSCAMDGKITAYPRFKLTETP